MAFKLINNKYLSTKKLIFALSFAFLSGLLIGNYSNLYKAQVFAAFTKPLNLLLDQAVKVSCDKGKIYLTKNNNSLYTIYCRNVSINPAPNTKPTISPTTAVTPTHAHTTPMAGHETPEVNNTGIISTAITKESLGTCTSQIHDNYVLTGPDGKKYRTWHPRVDTQSGCVFGHEHGDNPTNSNISGIQSVLFSYYDQGTEAHEGFKVGVINSGDKNNEGSTALNSTRITVHQGTGGAKRFTTQMHSMEVAFLGGPNGKNSGQKFIIGGMADTGNVGSICDNPRQKRTVMQTNCNETSGYEIWEFNLNGIIVSWAVFDPITERNPSDNTAIALPGNKGCTHEFYAGPFNTNSGTFKTQFGSLPNGLGYLATYKDGQAMSQFKVTRDACQNYDQIGKIN